MTPEVLRYSVLRLLIFAAVLAGLFVAGARGVMLLLLGALISMALSYLLLRRQRDALTAALVQRTEARLDPEVRRADQSRLGRLRRRIQDDEAAEDAEIAATNTEASVHPDQPEATRDPSP